MGTRVLIVYNSVYQGNTEKVARVIAKTLEARLAKPYEFKKDMLSEYDLVGFGSGIYFEKYHRALLSLAAELPGAKGKKAFVFSTSGWGNVKYNDPFKKLLSAKGFDVIGNFACKGFDPYGFVKVFGGVNKGRPDEKDLEEAASFAAGLKTKT